MYDITAADWLAWRDLPMTRMFFETIENKREEAIRVLAYGNYAGSPGKQSIMVGAINAYTHVLDAKFEGDENGRNQTGS